MINRLCGALLACVFLPIGILAQSATPAISSSVPEQMEITQDTPAWLLRAWGRQARLDHRLEDAFLYLTRSLERNPNNPETLTELALAYSDSGDDLQARNYLAQALENRVRLSSADLEYYILYQLADIYNRNGSDAEYILEYQGFLQEIIERDSDFSSDDAFIQETKVQMRRVLSTSVTNGEQETSLDRLVTLYRLEDSFSLRAHLLLGEFYVHSGRYRDALDHLSFAVLKIYTMLIEKVREQDPLYSFENSAQLFEIVSQHSQWIAYMRESRFDEALYYLGSALFGEQVSPAVYQGVWSSALKLPFESSYTQRAKNMLEAPRIEELRYGNISAQQ